jgi:hypothetical protein
MSIQQLQRTTYRSSGVSMPLSTKIVSTLGGLLVLGGLLMGAWDKLSSSIPKPAPTPTVPLGQDGETLPELHLFLPGTPVLLIVVFAAGLLVLSRGMRSIR